MRALSLCIVWLVAWLVFVAPALGAQQTAFTFPAGTHSATAAVQFVNGQIVMRVQVGARGFDVILDSGSSENVLDPSVFSALQLSADADNGAILPPASIGDVQVQGLHVVARPYFRHLDQTTAVVGIVGYEFLRNVVVCIDYQRGKLTLFDPEYFEAPQNGAYDIPLEFEKKTPLVRAVIGSAAGKRFVVDTGATTVVVFSAFARQHPDEFAPSHELHDSGDYHYYRRYFPVCGLAEHQPYAVDSVAIGNLSLTDWVVWEPADTSCLNYRALDGLIGYDFLRLFTVYIDYPRSRIVLQPNELYSIAAGTPKR